MRPLVRVRRATPFDPDFLRRSRLLWPLEPAVARLGRLADFPEPSVLDGVFGGEPPVRFVASVPRGRRRNRIDPGSLYDGRITLERRVPTRARCWHDLMNALVWGTFPDAKLALHARQHHAIGSRLEPGARVLPPTRTPELDALALLDEGGMVVSAEDPAATRVALRVGPGALRATLVAGHADAIVFGHAIFESLVLGVLPAAVAAVVLPRAPAQDDPVRWIDLVLASALEDITRFRTPGELCRVDLREADSPDSGGRC